MAIAGQAGGGISHPVRRSWRPRQATCSTARGTGAARLGGGGLGGLLLALLGGRSGGAGGGPAVRTDGLLLLTEAKIKTVLFRGSPPQSIDSVAVL